MMNFRAALALKTADDKRHVVAFRIDISTLSAPYDLQFAITARTYRFFFAPNVKTPLFSLNTRTRV